MLTLFSSKNQHWKNGIWFWSKALNKLVGEDRYEKLRLLRRVNGMKFYYARQNLLYETFILWPDLANLIGIYPKVDTSHGFPFPFSYEMYRDFQENTLNSDGSFSMWILMFGSIYFAHVVWTYMLPYYWVQGNVKNDDYTRMRMQDAIGTITLEETFGNQFAEYAFVPHLFAYQRQRGMLGYRHPDDPRLMHMGTFNRKNKAKEHYMTRVGDQHSMLYPK